MATPCEDGSIKRGPTTMSKFARRVRQRGKYDIQWNPKGQPIGEYRNQFVGYIALRGRMRAPISIDSWKKVSQEIKDLIWEDITNVFEISPDKKKWVIGRAGERWKGFKCQLTKHYLKNDDGTIRMQPPPEYDYISQEVWDAFVESRMSEAFKEKSNTYRAIAAKNDFSYRGSRKGYAGIEEEMLSEKSLDTSKSTISREELWKRARVDKDGNFTSEYVKEVADRIDSLSNGASDVQMPAEIEDVLSWALGKKDHGGSVRGVGSGITMTGYFGRKSAPSDTLCLKLLEQFEIKMLEMQRKIDALESKNCTVPTQQSEEEIPPPLNQDDGPTQSEEAAQASSLNQDEEPTQSEEEMHTSSFNQKPTQLEEDVHTSRPNHREESQVHILCAKHQKKPTRVGKDVSMKYSKEPEHTEEEARVSSPKKRAIEPSKSKEVPTAKRSKGPTDLTVGTVNISSGKYGKELAQTERVGQVPNLSSGISVQELLAGPVKCQMMLHNPFRAVAVGRVFLNHDNLPEMLHWGTVGPNLKKVIVDTPLEPDAPLPVPMEEARVVDDAVGTFVAWPMDLLSLDLMALQAPPSKVKRTEITHTKASMMQPMPQFSTPMSSEENTEPVPRCSTLTSPEKHAAESLSELRVEKPESVTNKRSARHRRGYTQRRVFL